MMKETSRYKLNKFLSEIPMDKVSFQADVTASEISRLQSDLNRLAQSSSLTVIVVENHTKRGVL